MGHETEEFFDKISHEFSSAYNISADFKERFAIWAGLIDKYSPAPEKALDLGCGSGVFTFYVSDKARTVIGIDASREMIAMCEQRKAERGARNATFMKGLIPQDFHEQAAALRADLVLCSSVIEYMEDPAELARFIDEAAEKKALLMISVPNTKSLYRKMEQLAYKLFSRPAYLRYAKSVGTLEQVRRLFERYGFHYVEHQYYGYANTCWRFLSRALPRPISATLVVLVFQRGL
ncbi:MAG: class I SAM-dependent methyltransferase [Planctomycetota bacterium]|nr:class I SAM-dependent methyltransferase [Planctomycetota bacterium]